MTTIALGVGSLAVWIARRRTGEASGAGRAVSRPVRAGLPGWTSASTAATQSAEAPCNADVAAQSLRLPAPTDSGKSLEVCLNSRTSAHRALGGTATEQQLANVLWAAGCAPVTGGRRTIYVATADGNYTYDPSNHALAPYASDRTDSAFCITYDRDRDFDAGVSYMFALLTAAADWSGTDRQLASCPRMADLDFDVGTVTGLTTEAVAQSSDGSLPPPRTDGPRTLAEVIGAARLADRFAVGKAPSAVELSQLLWAAYGCTPHFASGGRAGLTVPSWRAEYFLLDTIYAVSDRVERYRMHSGANLTTRDHRLELVHDADVRSGLRAALPGLPEAPCYVVLCLPRASAAQWYAMLEVGFAAGGILLQATALDLGCGLRAGLSSAEQDGVRQAAHLPGEHVPHAVASVGRPLSASTPGPAYVPFVEKN